MRHPPLIGLLALFAFSLSGCWEGIRVHVLATVLTIHGQARVQPNKSANALPITTESTIGGGDTVITDAGSELNLMLIPGIMVRLFEHSELQIKELSLTKDGNETE